MTTIMVSPTARLTASRMPPTMPGSAAGISTFIMVSLRVAPRASEPSRIVAGTARRASSDSEEMKGINMMPMTAPAASALLGETAMPSTEPNSRTDGATISAAKKP